MSQKLKFHLKWIILVVFVLAGLAFVVLKESPEFISLTVTPETVFSSTTTNQTLLSFNLKLKSELPAWSVFVKTVSTTTGSGLKVTLVKQADDTYIGNTPVPSGWLDKAQTISFGLYINGIKVSSNARFAITDVPVTLPPDPGEAGKLTLEGIDSDNDGVRDDLQREIVFIYPGNDEVRRVLRAMVKKEQQLVTTTGGHEWFKSLAVSSLAFQNCYNYLVFGIHLADHSKLNYLLSLVPNTKQRMVLYDQNSRTALPYGSTIDFSANSCTVDLGQDSY